MKTRIFAFAALAALLITGFAACKFTEENTAFSQRPDLPDEPFDYSLKMSPQFAGNIFTDPSGLPITGFGFGFNHQNPVIQDHGATLGRVLFYDPQLSLNNSISCASCHKQELAFSDGVAASTGFAGKVTPRNSMAIINAGFNQNLFWDSRVQSVAQLATKPIQNHIEMGMEEMIRLTQKLAKVEYYSALFEKAYGDPSITEERIGRALAQFVCSITSSNAKFDREELNGFAGFNTMERMGKDLFFSSRTNCNRCHAAPNFAAPDFVGGEYGSNGGTFGGGGEDLRGTANNGLDLVYTDQGLGNGKFRIPSLRNIALTAPYMHDGRHKTLEEVIEHYNSGVKPHTHLDKNLRSANGTPLRPDLNSLEKQALLAFLHTLTDEKMMHDEKWSNPFK
jgi:cytochrome c peroxidase